jgi:DeoR/GlpR family transcriptional regulator of sugar metabolism
LADATKFSFTALNYVAQITDFDLVLLTGEVPQASLEQLRKAGVNFELV